MADIREFHAHVYFDSDTRARARDLCERARDLFGVEMGRVHEKNVGPHPCWSCQLRVMPAQFGQVIPWLALNRQGLTVFVHPDTGDTLADHTEHTMWMGQSFALDLSVF